MGNKKIAQQAKDFLYELNNAKHEYSFSSTDSWVFSESTAKEKQSLEDLFYPVLFTRCDAEELHSLAGYFIPPVTDVPEIYKKIPTAVTKDRVFLVAHCENKLK